MLSIFLSCKISIFFLLFTAPFFFLKREALSLQQYFRLCRKTINIANNTSVLHAFYIILEKEFESLKYLEEFKSTLAPDDT